ncbi:MAG TPA: Smr/MutS family protein [Legionellaceae bacterium]|nr:Smr/MutS family protein [Legionellaceae bacterium]
MTKNSSISPEDRALFHAMMRDVVPLSKKNLANQAEKTIPPQRSPIIVDYDLSDYYQEPVQAEDTIKYHRAGLRNTQIQVLKAGQLIYTAKLDLHGFKPDEAKSRLSQFIYHHVHEGHRWVLIIHGKGGRFGEIPVLKNLINHWLRQIPDVLAFHSALPKHGDTGAVYVLLRRQNKA